MTAETTKTITPTSFTDADAQRFLAKVALPADLLDPNPCWFWRGAKHGQDRGYGKFRLKINGESKVISAHKASHLLFNGEVADSLVVGHICNNEQCVNPYHLVAQSQSDNIAYSVICGRHNSQRKYGASI